MDNELKLFLEAMEARLTRRVDESAKALEDRLMKRIDEAVTKRIDEAVTAAEDRLIERIRDTETTLLTEFHKWASPVDGRVRALSSMVRVFDADLEYIQDRLKKLENRPTGT